jgi:hypothetical protein
VTRRSDWVFTEVEGFLPTYVPVRAEGFVGESRTELAIPAHMHTARVFLGGVTTPWHHGKQHRDLD